MPEFLTEKNYINDFIYNKDWIFGLLGLDEKQYLIFEKKIRELFLLAIKNDRIKYNNIHFLKKIKKQKL